MLHITLKLLQPAVRIALKKTWSICWRGQVGTVVEVLAGGTAFEVEFSDRNGRAYESVGLRPDQIMVLRFEPASPDLTCEMATVY